MMDTNTIHVLLPPGESLHAATTAFRQFGEVSSLELLPGDALVASVVFFDVRAAWAALQALGTGVAHPAPQTGSRLARLMGNTNLKVDEIRGVSNVQYEPIRKDGAGAFTVEFYDIRDAMKLRELGETEPKACSGAVDNVGADACGAVDNSDPSDVPGPRGPVQEPVPVYVIPSAMQSMPAAAVPNASALHGRRREFQPTHYTVRIIGLPNALLSKPCTEAILQQAGLLEAAINFRTEFGQPYGEAIVTFLSFAMAQLCILHFQGRQWNTSGGEVTAWLEPNDSAAPGEWAGADCGQRDERWRRRCDSDKSTEASTTEVLPSELEEERDGDTAARY
mmetsp:Transcript_27804/g.62870  ORF Transcript_27804/g.62870 Transcript_27804/m.62870 type:complete len:336 (+) Transcript_27804:47-1054(+)